MGGLLKPSTPQPLPMPEPTPVDTTAEDEEKRRIDLINRRKRGRRGLITTSEGGLLGLNDISSRQKTLLGD